MIEIGKIQRLRIVRKTSNGVYLSAETGNEMDDVLLPGNQTSEELEIGDEIEVFIYRDSEDRTIATVRKPKLVIGEMTALRVVETTSIGAFLDWGLEKDLFLPYKEQVGTVVKNGTYFVSIYLDKTGRLCATMKTYNLLSTKSPFKENDRVRGTICSINKDLGVFVAVENKYQGMIPKKEMYSEFIIGENIEVRIKKIRPDGKLELSTRNEAYKEIETDATKVMDYLKNSGGLMMLNDSSSPEKIKAELNISKAAFKRAIGRLLKEGAIEITENGIAMKW